VAKGSRSLASFLFRLDRAQDPCAPFVAAFIYELVSEGRHDPNQIKGLILTNNPGLVLASRFQEGPRPYCCAASSAVTSGEAGMPLKRGHSLGIK
jgi:hypothetical protein